MASICGTRGWTGDRTRAARMLGLALAASAAASVAPAAPPDATVSIHPTHFEWGGRRFEDLDALERALDVALAESNPRSIRLDACGDGTARPLLAAAHRLRQARIELRVLDAEARECSSALGARAQPVGQRLTAPGMGIDDEAVARWWRSMMP